MDVIEEKCPEKKDKNEEKDRVKMTRMQKENERSRDKIVKISAGKVT